MHKLAYNVTHDGKQCMMGSTLNSCIQYSVHLKFNQYIFETFMIRYILTLYETDLKFMKIN